MRSYPKNSPEATARIIAMTVLSDGQLDMQEMHTLEHAMRQRGLAFDKDRLHQVIQAFCQDLLLHAPIDASDNCQLKPAVIGRLLNEIDDPVLQRRLCRVALDVIGADRRVHRGESLLLWAALDAWNLKLMDCLTELGRPVRFESTHPPTAQQQPQHG